MPQTISSAFAWWARMRPDQPALIFGEDRLTFGALHDWSERIAAHLMRQGIAPGDRVGICATNSPSYCALLMGIIRAGAICNPIHFRYTTREIADLTETTTPAIVYALPEYEDKVRAAGLKVQPISEIAALRTGPAASVRFDPQPDDAIVIIATSGSTAKPKGVVYTNRSMTAYAAAWAAEEPAAAPGSRVIILAPLNTSAGFVQFMHYTTLGCSCYMLNSFAPAEALHIIVEEKINIFAAVPVFFEAIAQSPGFGEADLSSIRMATVGGARVSRALQDDYRAKGVTLRQIYGQTEIGGNATIMPADRALDAPDRCGWGGIFMDIAVVRPDGSRCDPDEQGEIIMRSPGMMQGYWRNPTETARTIRNGWLHSGDIGVMDERGMLRFVDRMKDFIISGGLNISAAEIEGVVSEVPGVIEVLAIAAPDPKFTETPMIIYHAAREIDVTALIAHCNAHLSNYKVPRYVVFSPEPLPRLATGKLSKPAVRALYADAHETLPRVR